MSRNSPTFRRSLAAVMLMAVSLPFNWPGADCTLLLRNACATSSADRPRAASLSGSSQMRIASVWPPIMFADATPGTAVMSGCATRETKSVIWGIDSVSLVKATYWISEAPSVILVITGSVAPGGRRNFTCCTLASTSVIDRSASALSTSLALIWLRPCVEVEVRYSMPLAVAIACAIGVVTKPCITSCVAPG